MKYLITGITGFAGPHLANLLISEGHDVYGLVRASNGRETDILDVVPEHYFNKIKFVYGDLTNFRLVDNIFKEHKFDGVFHLAAQSHPPTSFRDPLGTFDSNIIGTANLIQAISDRQKECHLLFASTSEVYGNSGISGQLILETCPLSPSNPYAASKAASDLYLQERFDSKFLPKVTITRAFSHTGPRRGKNFSISSDAFQIAKMITGKTKDRILKVGNLTTTRVVMDVKDCVKAYYLLMLRDNFSNIVYNVCGDIPRKMEFYTDKLIEISNLKEVIKEIDPNLYRPIDIYYQHGDISRINKDIDFKPLIDIHSTLSELLTYWVNKLR